MRDTVVRMKDGSVFCGPIYSWKPTEGYLTLVGTAGTKLYFKDMQSALTQGAKVGTNPDGSPKVEVQDEIARASREGWTSVKTPIAASHTSCDF